MLSSAVHLMSRYDKQRMEEDERRRKQRREEATFSDFSGFSEIHQAIADNNWHEVKLLLTEEKWSLDDLAYLVKVVHENRWDSTAREAIMLADRIYDFRSLRWVEHHGNIRCMMGEIAMCELGHM